MSLIVQDFAGVHNSDLPKTSARLIKGGSWKKQRIVMILPAGGSIPSKVYLSHINLMFPPNQGVVRILAQGMEVGDAYTQAIEQVLAHPDLKDWEYILTIEHDNCPPSDGVLRLIETMEANPGLSCVGGLYFTKGPEGVAQIWGDPSDSVLNFRPQPPREGQIVECCGTGMGFNLFKLSMFKDPNLRKPWFRTTAGAEGCATQDLYFWGDARKNGYRCAVDCRVRVGHYDQASDIVW
jgi:hypothetical protein